MAGILIPEKAPELFAYLGIIIRAERNYQTGAWVAYDRQYRRKALARRDLNWSTAFTGRAKTLPRCELCLNADVQLLVQPHQAHGQLAQPPGLAYSDRGFTTGTPQLP